jgi:undecaprenyl diphosphate synthase
MEPFRFFLSLDQVMNGVSLPTLAIGEAADVQSAAVPRHVAIIMDGNGRWAAQRGWPRLAGHQHGTDNIRPITTSAAELGIRYLTLWAFSTDNWRRPRDEIDGILRILAEVIERETEQLHRQGAQLRHIGSLEGLDDSLQEAVNGAIARTSCNDRLVLTLAFNYRPPGVACRGPQPDRQQRVGRRDRRGDA